MPPDSGRASSSWSHLTLMLNLSQQSASNAPQLACQLCGQDIHGQSRPSTCPAWHGRPIRSSTAPSCRTLYDWRKRRLRVGCRLPGSNPLRQGRDRNLNYRRWQQMSVSGGRDTAQVSPWLRRRETMLTSFGMSDQAARLRKASKRLIHEIQATRPTVKG